MPDRRLKASTGSRRATASVGADTGRILSAGECAERLQGEDLMSRVAMVTGGTRGIGAAISKALNAAGYKVAANYGGTDEVAAKFKADTGINVYKWDVSSYDAC